MWLNFSPDAFLEKNKSAAAEKVSNKSLSENKQEMGIKMLPKILSGDAFKTKGTHYQQTTVTKKDKNIPNSINITKTNMYPLQFSHAEHSDSEPSTVVIRFSSI